MSHKIGAIATLAILTACGEVAYEPAVTTDASLPEAADAADAAADVFRDAGYDASDAGFRADADASLPVDADVDADAALPPEKVIDVSVGVEYVCALFESHRIKCWGNGFGGELGTGVATWRGAHPGELTPQTPFVDVGPARTITSVHAGSGSTFVLLDNHQVGAWGLNRFGSLGAGIAEESGSFQMGSGLLHVLLGSNRTVTELSADNGVGCALLDDGSVKCWGWNIRGSLGLGDTTDRGSDATQMGNALPAVDLAGGPVRHVSVSEGATCAVFMDGRLKCWGRNIGYLLGVGDALDRGDGPNEMGTALPFVPLGTAWKTSTVSPGFPACALSTDGRVKCWGLASGGQLGTGDGRDRIALADLGDALPALSFGGGIVTQLVASAGSAYALLADGSVWAWGDNATGTLGVGTTTNAATPVLVNLGANVRVAKIHTRRWTTCAVTTDGRVKCWGDNKYGQLGLGDQRTRGGAPSDMGDNLPFIDL